MNNKEAEDARGAMKAQQALLDDQREANERMVGATIVIAHRVTIWVTELPNASGCNG